MTYKKVVIARSFIYLCSPSTFHLIYRRGEHAFRNEIKTPVILVPALPEIPVTLRSEEFHSRLRVVEWKDPSLFEVMPVGRMAATILNAAEGCGEISGTPLEFDRELSTFQHISAFNKKGLSV